MDTQYILFILLVFIAALFGLEAIFYWWRNRFGDESVRLKKRLESITNHDLDRVNYQGILKKRYAENNTIVGRILAKFSVMQRLDTLLLQSGALWSLNKFVKSSLASSAAATAVGILLKMGASVTLALFFFGLMIPTLYLIQLKNKRTDKFEEQLPEAIDTICRSLKAGHTFTSAFTLVGEELADPLATEFRVTMEEHNLGVTINEAMQNLSERMPITDLKFFIVAVLIQRETGGNLAEILSNISNIMRERFTLRRQINVMTAEGRLSAKVLGFMPLIMLGVMSAINPNYSTLMFSTPTGIYYLKVGAVAMLIGLLWMRSIINIKM